MAIKAPLFRSLTSLPPSLQSSVIGTLESLSELWVDTNTLTSLPDVSQLEALFAKLVPVFVAKWVVVVCLTTWLKEAVMRLKELFTWLASAMVTS